MTYQKFLNITYNTAQEKDYYCWAATRRRKTLEIGEEDLKYSMYCDKLDRINKFKQEVLTKALKDLPDNYFD